MTEQNCCGTESDCGHANESGCTKTGQCSLPEVTFSTFILSLASSALVHLGEVPDPESGHVGVNLEVAKHSIDILSMLQNKTRECLDSDEHRLLEGILYELRIKYVAKKG